MTCWNCHREMPEGAMRCGNCEAEARPPLSPEESACVLQVSEQMPPEVIQAMIGLAQESSTVEEFVARIMVGPCPSCTSLKTGDCEEDPELLNNLVARCYDCGHVWCVQCDQALDKRHPFCPCWNEVID